jgi:Iron only hydrogenase large subunit, C-terminal domain
MRHSAQYTENIKQLTISICLSHIAQDFMHEVEDESKYQEVDLVLSTTELWMLLERLAGRGTGSAEELHSEINMTRNDPSVPVPVPISVQDYLLSHISPDLPQGRDDFESLFRSYSEDGRAFVAAADTNAGSGAYIEYLFRYASERLFGVSLWGKPLVYTPGRNPDMHEVDIQSQDIPNTNSIGSNSRADWKLKFCRANGFRNIQSVMLKMKTGKCDYDFVEIMACPSGCVNGGGQLKVASQVTTPAQATSAPDASSGVTAMDLDIDSIGMPKPKSISAAAATATATSGVRESPSESRQRVAAVESRLNEVVVRRPDDSPLVKAIFSGDIAPQHPQQPSGLSDSSSSSSLSTALPLALGPPLSELAVATLHTSYHAVPKLEKAAPLAAKW